jgi:hypothetical protein
MSSRQFARLRIPWSGHDGLCFVFEDHFSAGVDVGKSSVVLRFAQPISILKLHMGQAFEERARDTIAATVAESIHTSR